MNVLSTRQAVELFHLLFLQQLGKTLDKKLYALKGGCNLRFYFKSIRYSEDLDIDVQIIAKETLRKKINTIIASNTFGHILKTHKITIQHSSEPKQTETTQRWKIQLMVASSTLPLNTKIEFSRRGVHDETLFEPIDVNLIRDYRLFPLMLNHYSMHAAYEQKVAALIHRTQTQARDIFDLYVLIGSGVNTALNKKLITHLAQAKENALHITFDDFKGQVLAYLSEGDRVQYQDKKVWQQMVDVVIQTLGGAA